MGALKVLNAFSYLLFLVVLGFVYSMMPAKIDLEIWTTSLLQITKAQLFYAFLVIFLSVNLSLRYLLKRWVYELPGGGAKARTRWFALLLPILNLCFPMILLILADTMAVGWGQRFVHLSVLTLLVLWMLGFALLVFHGFTTARRNPVLLPFAEKASQNADH